MVCGWLRFVSEARQIRRVEPPDLSRVRLPVGDGGRGRQPRDLHRAHLLVARPGPGGPRDRTVVVTEASPDPEVDGAWFRRGRRPGSVVGRFQSGTCRRFSPAAAATRLPAPRLLVGGQHRRSRNGVFDVARTLDVVGALVLGRERWTHQPAGNGVAAEGPRTGRRLLTAQLHGLPCLHGPLPGCPTARRPHSECQ